MVINKENLKDLQLDDIIAYCKENNQIEWLKAIAQTTVERKTYPTVTYFDKNGKERTKQDKTQEPIKVEQVPIPYVQLKFEFLKKFFPELVADKSSKGKPTMWDIIAAL